MGIGVGAKAGLRYKLGVLNLLGGSKDVRSACFFYPAWPTWAHGLKKDNQPVPGTSLKHFGGKFDILCEQYLPKTSHSVGGL